MLAMNHALDSAPRHRPALPSEVTVWFLSRDWPAELADARGRGMWVVFEVNVTDGSIDQGHVIDPRTRRFFTFALLADPDDASGYGVLSTSSWCPMDDEP